jgi:hypothetical protein
MKLIKNSTVCLSLPKAELRHRKLLDLGNMGIEGDVRVNELSNSPAQVRFVNSLICKFF